MFRSRLPAATLAAELLCAEKLCLLVRGGRPPQLQPSPSPPPPPPPPPPPGETAAATGGDGAAAAPAEGFAARSWLVQFTAWLGGEDGLQLRRDLAAVLPAYAAAIGHPSASAGSGDDGDDDDEGCAPAAPAATMTFRATVRRSGRSSKPPSGRTTVALQIVLKH